MKASPQTAKSTMRVTKVDLSGRNFSTPAIEIYGGVFPNLLIEAVADLERPEQLCLQTWDGRRAKTASQVSYQGQMYVAGPITAGLAQAVRFPPGSRRFGSVASLVSSMRDVFCRYANLSPQSVSILAAFSLASWVADCLPRVPILHLVGPESEVSLVLRLLGCTCRRPLLLGDVDMAHCAVNNMWYEHKRRWQGSLLDWRRHSW